MNDPFFSPTDAQAEQADPGTIVSTGTSAVGKKATTDVVGSVLLSEVEQELDAVIRELGQKMVQADQDGDPTGRDIFASRMYAAIRSRTPEHQDRLLAEADKRIDEARTSNGVCYFSSDAAQALGRGRAAP